MASVRAVVTASLGAVGFLSATPTRAGGQNASDLAAFVALALTPAAALPPAVRAPVLHGELDRGAFTLRYGRYKLHGSDDVIHNVGLGGDFSMRGGRAGVTLAVETCLGCDGAVMLGLDFTRELVSTGKPDPTGRSRAAVVSVALHAAGGVGRRLHSTLDVTALSAAAELPLSLATNLGGHAELIPFLAPGAGFGLYTTHGRANGGTRPMLGGGVGVANIGPGFALTVGFQHVFVERAPTLWGVGFTWHGTPR